MFNYIVNKISLSKEFTYNRSILRTKQNQALPPSWGYLESLGSSPWCPLGNPFLEISHLCI